MGEGILFGLICFLSRIYHVTLLPIFTDESIYIYWAKHIQTLHDDWFISLYDGKPPIFIWLIATFLSFFPSTWYLFAGRLVSVLASVGTILGIYSISMVLFNDKRVARISSFVYIITPFSYVYDRLALFDSLFTTMLVWTVYFMFKTANSYSYKHAMLWGGFLGLAFLVKPPALIFFLLTPVCFFVLVRGNLGIKRMVFLLLPVVLISWGMNSLLRVSGNYQAMVVKNAQFQLSLIELFRNPFQLLLKNLSLFFHWIYIYYTLPIFLVGILSFILLVRYKPRIGSVFLLLWGASILMIGLIGKVVFPRYLVFLTPYVVIPIGFLIAEVAHEFKGLHRRYLSGLSLLLLPPFIFIFTFARFPSEAKLPNDDYDQFVSSYTSGYGLEPVFTYLERESRDKKIILITEGTFGLFPYAFELQFRNNPNMQIISREKIEFIDPELYALKSPHTFFVFQKHQYVPGGLLLKEIVRGEKPMKDRNPIILATFL